jgi:hypothetical protein
MILIHCFACDLDITTLLVVSRHRKLYPTSSAIVLQPRYFSQQVGADLCNLTPLEHDPESAESM